MNLVNDMYTIRENSIYSCEIKKSKFIVLLFKVDSISEIYHCLQNVKDNYQDATHYCYGYKLDGMQKFSDDGEPGGTAGLPIIEILNRRELHNILCIVVRYFGGIKLGAGGLIRAYSNTVKEALNACDLIELVPGYFVSITLDYSEQKSFDYLFRSYIIKKDFSTKVTYHLQVPKDRINLLTTYNYQVLEEILIQNNFSS